MPEHTPLQDQQNNLMARADHDLPAALKSCCPLDKWYQQYQVRVYPASQNKQLSPKQGSASVKQASLRFCLSYGNPFVVLLSAPSCIIHFSAELKSHNPRL